MNPNPSQLLVNFRQASELLSISLRQFRRLVDDGFFPTVRVSKRAPRVRIADVEKFIASATETRRSAP